MLELNYIMKKVFVVAGELSGDQIGAWYLKRRYQEDADIYVQAIGGDFIAQAGATLYDRFEKLNLVGIVEIVGSLPWILRYIRTLVSYIKNNSIDELVLIDFPGFNLRLARFVKKACPSIKIIYVSPPQLWVWGAWRASKLARYVDELEVIYSFEVDWYARRGITARWLGYPFFDELAQSVTSSPLKKNRIALIPGSRQSEIKTLLPIFAQSIHRLKLRYADVEIIMPRAESLSRSYLEEQLARYDLHATIIEGRKEKLRALSSCLGALTKPGTVTLELAFLQVPAIVAYKTSWLTYHIARLLVGVDYMALPNLLLNKPVYPEYIQSQCRVSELSSALITLYKGARQEHNLYQERCRSLAPIRSILSKNGPF